MYLVQKGSDVPGTYQLSHTYEKGNFESCRIRIKVVTLLRRGRFNDKKS